LYLQACHFRRDIVGLDVCVNATLVVHPLDLHNRFVGRGHTGYSAVVTARRKAD